MPSYAFLDLASFNGTNGSNPSAGLITYGSGNLYGTTSAGGVNGGGTVFEIKAGSSTITTLASFNGTNGSNPMAGLVMDGGGNLYGTTSAGGVNGDGTVFEIAAGSHTIITLASFNGANGSDPTAPVVLDGSGNLYGTTERGGTFSKGTVFEIAAGSETITTLASFFGFNGANPTAGLILDGSGNLYGATNGGLYGDGMVFEIAAGSATITMLGTFNGTNGAEPTGLILDGSGNLYGTTSAGGVNGDGTVFEIAAGSHSITTLASFNGINGANPVAGLVLDGSGNLYGTTSAGGVNGDGTVFEITAGSHTIAPLASFNGTNGSDSEAGLIMDSSSDLYGTTYAGGANEDGTVFELVRAVKLAFVQQPTNFSFGSTISPPVTVDVEDGNGDVIQSDNSNVTLAIGPGSTGSGSLNGTLTVAAVNGVATFSGVGVSAAGTYTLTATDGALQPAISTSFTAMAQLVFVVQPSDATAGSPIIPAVTVQVEGNNGKLVTSDNSNVTLTISSGTLNGTLTEQAVNGVATFSGLSITRAGGYTLSAADSADSLSGFVSDSFVIAPAPASKLVFATEPANAFTGTTISPPVTVDVEDAYGNVVASDTSTVSLSLSSGTLGGTSSVAAVNGAATFSNLSIFAPGSYILTASDGTLTPATSASFTVSSVAGTWQVAGELSQGTFTLDNHGRVTGGSIQDNNGTSVTLTGGSYAVEGNGNLTMTCEDAAGETYTWLGSVNASRDVIAVTETPFASASSNLGVMVLNTGTFSDADLSGSWAFTMEDVSGSLAFDGKGRVTGGNWVEQNGSTGGFLSGSTYNVTSDGLVTMTLFAPSSEHPGQRDEMDISGALNASQDTIAADEATDASELEHPTLVVLTKPTGTFAVSDLFGTLAMTSSGTTGTVVFNGAGKVTGGGYTNAAGTFSILSGTYTVGPTGQVKANILTNDPSNAASSMTGSFNSAKDTLVMNNAKKNLPNENNGFLLVLTNPSATDLVGEFGAITIPNPAIPGDRGNVSVVVTNQGKVRATGSMTINLYASTTEGGDEIYLGHWTNQLVNLGYGQSQKYTFNGVQLPANLAAGSYYLRADINATQTIPEGDYSNDTVVASTGLPVVYEFGTVGARKNVILTLTDADGTIATFMLPGVGTGTVTVGADGWDLDVTGSTTASSLVITTRKSTTPGDNGQITLHNFTVEGPLALVRGLGVNLSGSMTVTGKLPLLMLNELTGGGGISIGGAATDHTALLFNQVEDESLTSGSTIGLLEAACWEDTDADDTDTITAPGLTTAMIRKGDLAANLNLGAGGITTLIVTGGSLTGDITDAGGLTTLLVNGGSITGDISAARVGMVVATGGDVSGDITSTATAAQLGALTGIGTVMVTGGDLSGDLTSNGNVSAVSVTRNALTGHGGNASGAFNLGGGLLGLTLTGGDFGGTLNVGGSLGTLSLNKIGANGGNVLAGASVNASAIGTLRAGGSFQGASGNGIAVNAGQITRLNVTGDIAYTALTLANPERKPTVAALGTLSVRGWMDDSQLLSDGSVTSVTVGGMEDSVAFAGVKLSNLGEPNGVWSLPSALSDFSSSDACLGTFTILGLKHGTTPIESLINSNIAAWNLGTVNLAYADGSNGVWPFGLACNQYGTLSYHDASGTKTWTKSNPAACLPGPDGVVRVITS